MPQKMIVEILEKRDIKGATLRTVQRDIATMKEWLPAIIRMQVDSTLIMAEVLGKIQVTQQRLLNLGETADNSSAQVGALRANVDAITAESDLRFKMGQIHAVPTQVEVKEEVKRHVFSPESFVTEYGDVFLDEVLRRRLQKDRGDDEENPGEPLDPSYPNS